MVTTTATEIAQAIREAIPAQIARAHDCVTITRREYAALESLLGRTVVSIAGTRKVAVRHPDTRHADAKITALIDFATEEIAGLHATGHIRTVDATTTILTW